jgi:hypothetical protein
MNKCIIAIFVLYSCLIVSECFEPFEPLFSRHLFKDWNMNFLDFGNGINNLQNLINKETKSVADVVKSIDKEIASAMGNINTNLYQLNEKNLRNLRGKNGVSNMIWDNVEQENLDSGCSCESFKCKCCTDIQFNQYNSHGKI